MKERDVDDGHLERGHDLPDEGHGQGGCHSELGIAPSGTCQRRRDARERRVGRNRRSHEHRGEEHELDHGADNESGLQVSADEPHHGTGDDGSSRLKLDRLLVDEAPGYPERHEERSCH